MLFNIFLNVFKELLKMNWNGRLASFYRYLGSHLTDLASFFERNLSVQVLKLLVEDDNCVKICLLCGREIIRYT
jgi:hypothetical protein